MTRIGEYLFVVACGALIGFCLLVGAVGTQVME